MKKQEKKGRKTLGQEQESLLKESSKKKKKDEKGFLSQKTRVGPITQQVCGAKNMDFRASNEFDEEGRNVQRKFQFKKSTCFAGFGDNENSVQILCKKTVLHLTLEKWGFGVSDGNRVNTIVVGNDKTNQKELKHEFSKYQIIPQVTPNTTKETPKGPTNETKF